MGKAEASRACALQESGNDDARTLQIFTLRWCSALLVINACICCTNLPSTRYHFKLTALCSSSRPLCVERVRAATLICVIQLLGRQKGLQPALSSPVSVRWRTVQISRKLQSYRGILTPCAFVYTAASRCVWYPRKLNVWILARNRGTQNSVAGQYFAILT